MKTGSGLEERGARILFGVTCTWSRRFLPPKCLQRVSEHQPRQIDLACSCLVPPWSQSGPTVDLTGLTLQCGTNESCGQTEANAHWDLKRPLSIVLEQSEIYQDTNELEATTIPVSCDIMSRCHNVVASHVLWSLAEAHIGRLPQQGVAIHHQGNLAFMESCKQNIHESHGWTYFHLPMGMCQGVQSARCHSITRTA